MANFNININMAASQPKHGQNYHLSGAEPAQTAQSSDQYSLQHHFDGGCSGAQHQQVGGNFPMAQQTQQMLPYINAHYVEQQNIYFSPQQAPTVLQPRPQTGYKPLAQEANQAIQAPTPYQTSNDQRSGDTTPQS